MRTPVKSLAVLTIAVLVTAFVVAIAVGPAQAVQNPNTKIAIHIRAHGTCKGLPTFSSCSNIITTYASGGDIDAIPVLFDIASYTVAEFGVTWPADWGTGSWSRCLGNIAIGTIKNPGEGTAISWSVCIFGWSVAPGFLWLAASDAGTVSAIPNPATGDMGVVDCTPTSEGGPFYDHPIAEYYAGVNGATGQDPCIPPIVAPMLTKTDNIGSASCAFPDSNVIYTLTYKNTNAAGLTEVTLVDSLSTGVTFISATGSYTFDAGTGLITWSIGSMAAGDSNAVNVTVKIKSATPGGSSVVNNARISCAETPTINTASVSTHVCACSIIGGPTVVCPGANSVFSAPNTVGFTYLWSVTGDASISGNNTLNAVNVVAGTTCGSSYTVHLTVTDASGIPSQCQRAVSINDTQLPTISSAPANLNLSCPNEVPAVNTGSVTGFDNCGAFNVTLLNADTTGTPCNMVITRTYRASDACGNHVDTTQTITVHDVTVPLITVCPNDSTVQCFSAVPDPDTDLVTASDNCGTVTVTFVEDVLNGSDCEGTVERTYRATDACGNFTDCVQTFAIADTTDPYFTTPCPADTTVECDAIPDLAVMTAADNCGNVTVYSDVQMVAGSCTNSYTQTRTWTAIDGCGNTAECVQIISVVDTEAPVLTCAANDTLDCGSTPVFTDPTVLDNCDIAPRLDHTDSSTPVSDGILHSRTWTATDACGNVSDPCTQTILVESCAFVPVTANKDDGLTGCVYPGGGINYSVSYTNPNGVEVHGVEVTDTLSTSLNFVSASNGGSYNAGNRTVTWSIGTLAVGGSGTLTLSVTVGAAVTPGSTVHNIAYTFCDEAGAGSSNDEATPVCACLITGPTSVCPGDTVQYSGPASMTSYAWTIDGTGTLVGVTNARNVNVATGGCGTSYTVHLQVNQGGGVISSCQLTANAQDSEQPSISCPSNLTIQCWESTLPARTGSANATDNCDVSPAVTYLDSTTAGTCPQKYVIRRTWTATDDCGNHNSCVQTITVTDTGAPVFTSHPNDTTVQCSSNVPAPSAESCTATDSCGVVTIIFFSDVSNGETCPEIITRTYKASDECGNFSYATQTITVDDTIPPTLTCAADDTVSCGADIAFTDPTVSDNCDGSPVLDFTDSETQEPGQITHTRCWTATDACGNVSAECCQNIVETGCTGCFITGVTETCPGATHQFCVAEGMDLYSWTVFGNGNITGVSDQACVSVVASAGCNTSFMVVAHVEVGSSASDCSLTVVVRDVANPQITSSPADTSVQCSDDVPDVNIGLVTATDNCSTPVVSWEGDVSDGESCPEVITRTYRVSDACGHSVDVLQHITVDDTIPPVITCAPDTMFSCDDLGDADQATATDNCTLEPSVAPSDSTIPVTPGAGCYTIVRTWTATDDCGNSSQCVQMITVFDDVPPTITCAADARIACTDPLVFTEPTALDNCAITPTITVISTDTTEVGAGEIEYTRCWEASDGCGNADTCCQTITREACPFVPLTLTKVDDVTTCVDPGGPVTYTLTYGNPNTATVTGVVVTDFLPDSVGVVDTHGGVYSAGPPRTVTWTIGNVIGGGSGEETLDVTVNSDVAFGYSFSNNAEVTSSETAPTTATVRTDVCEFTYTALRLTKNDMLGGQPAAPGDTIDYQIDVYNDNALAVTNVVIVDQLPSDAIFITATTPYSYDSGDNSVTWDLGDIDGASSVTLTLEVQVDPEATSGSFVNVVSASSDQTTTPGEATETTRIVGGEIGIYFDVKPATCPNTVETKAKGVLPAAVLGTADFNVHDIDPATLRLTREGFAGTVSPIRWSYEDVASPFTGDLCGCNVLGPDGYGDLAIKFTLQDVVNTLGLASAKGQTIQLVLTGELEDGTEIRGADCVQVLGMPSGGSIMPSAGVGFETGTQVGMPEGGQISLSFFTSSADRVRLDVYDVHGRLVKNLVDADMGAGSHLITWNLISQSGIRVPAGIYFARISNGRESATAKVVIVE